MWYSWELMEEEYLRKAIRREKRKGKAMPSVSTSNIIFKRAYKNTGSRKISYKALLTTKMSDVHLNGYNST